MNSIIQPFFLMHGLVCDICIQQAIISYSTLADIKIVLENVIVILILCLLCYGHYSISYI